MNLDLVAAAPSLPAPGETVGGAKFSRYPGGKGANQALAARRQGAEVTLIAAVGEDELATEALALLEADGVDLSRLARISAESTGVALIVVDDTGENQIAVAPGANDKLGPFDVEAAGFDAVLCQNEIRDDTLAAAAGQATGLFCLNAAPARPIPEPILRRADVIIVNEIEYEALRPQLVDFGGLLVVTRGAKGAEAYQFGTSLAAAEPPAIEAVDTVGAGDAFCGALVVHLARGLPIANALSRACRAGAIAATRPGAQTSLPFASDHDTPLSSASPNANRSTVGSDPSQGTVGPTSAASSGV